MVPIPPAGAVVVVVVPDVPVVVPDVPPDVVPDVPEVVPVWVGVVVVPVVELDGLFRIVLKLLPVDDVVVPEGASVVRVTGAET
jgi:hypothetical protein